MDFDARIADRADGDGQGDPLEERKVHVDVEGLAWKPAKRSVMIWNFFRTASR